jgi:hypothetical protein
MGRINRDVVVAVFLALGCGVFFWSSFDIREPDYGTLAPATWPRVILAYLSVLSVIYLIQSLRLGADAEAPAGGGIRGWLARYRNPLWCYALFFLFLMSLPVLGMLIGGSLFVFVLLSVIGGFGVRKSLLHAAIAVVFVGAMWALFTFSLGVILPQGQIFTTL